MSLTSILPAANHACLLPPSLCSAEQENCCLGASAQPSTGAIGLPSPSLPPPQWPVSTLEGPWLDICAVGPYSLRLGNQ